MNKEQLDSFRSDYMAATKELVFASITRNEFLNDACPRAMQTKEERDESLKQVAKQNRTIADLCNRCRAVEKRANDGIGIPALFGQDIPNVLRVVVAVLGAKCLAGGTLEHETRMLSRLVSMTAGAHNPDDLLTVREAFRKTGILRPHVHLEPGRTIDELQNITLTETAFRKLLALESDAECEDLMQARALVAVAGRKGQ